MPSDADLARLDDLLAKVLGLPRDRVGPGLSSRTEAAWDSLRQLRVVRAVSEAFGVRFRLEEAERATSRAALAAVLDRHAARG